MLVPPEFPERYRVAPAHAASHCRVKKVLAVPPELAVETKVTGNDFLVAAGATR